MSELDANWQKLELEYKQQIRYLNFENEQLSFKIQELDLFIKNNFCDEENVDKKLLISAKKELFNVKLILESSEQDRVSESKKRLLTVQELVRLTEENSCLEEKFDLYLRRNVYDKKYSRLFAKYEDCLQQMKGFHETAANEKQEIHQKYLSMIRNLKIKQETDLRDVLYKRKTLEQLLKSVVAKVPGDSGIEDCHSSSQVTPPVSHINLFEKRKGPDEVVLNEEALIKVFKQYERAFAGLQESNKFNLQLQEGSSKDSLVKHLIDDKRDLEEEVEHLRWKLKESEKHLIYAESALKKETEDLLQENRDLKVENEELKNNEMNLHENLEDLQIEFDQNMTMLGKRDIVISELRRELEVREMSVLQIETNSSTYVRQLEVKQMESNRVRADCEELQRSNDKYVMTVENLTAELSVYRSKELESRKQILELQEKIEQLEVVESQLERLTTEHTNVLERLANEFIMNNTKLSDYEDKVGSLEMQNTLLETKLRENITADDAKESHAGLSVECLFGGRERSMKQVEGIIEEEVDEKQNDEEEWIHASEIARFEELVDKKDEASNLVIFLRNENKLLKEELRGQQKRNKSLADELAELTANHNVLSDILLKTRLKLREVSQASVLHENTLNLLRLKEVEQLKSALQVSKNERETLKVDLQNKELQLADAKTSYQTFKQTVDYTMGKIDAEKRSNDFIDEQMKLVVKDHGHIFYKLNTAELLKEMFQCKLKTFQGWHNSVEMSLLAPYEPHTSSSQPVDFDLEIRKVQQKIEHLAYKQSITS